MLIKSSILSSTVLATFVNGQVRPQDVMNANLKPVCAIETSGAFACGLWRQLCTGDCTFVEGTALGGSTKCNIGQAEGCNAGCGCKNPNICKCALNGLEYNIGRYCSPNKDPCTDAATDTGTTPTPPVPPTSTSKKYMIQATGTNYCLDMRNGGTPDDDVMVINQCDKSAPSQDFIIESRDKGEGNIVKIRSSLEQDLCLQTIADVARRRTLLQLGNCEGLTNEFFILGKREGSGTIRSLPLAGEGVKSLCMVPRGWAKDVGPNAGMVLKKCKKAADKGMIYLYTLVEI